jgi:hypothetical protein
MLTGQPYQIRVPSKTLDCKRCGKPFKAYHSKIVRGRAKYCSKACADVELLFKKGQHASPCTEIKKGVPLPEYIRSKQIGKTPWNYKGFTYNDQGYKLVHAPKHKYADKDGNVREHRIVVEKVIGRELHTFEVVHHINEIRDDNSIENLMVFRSNAAHLRYHRGLPVADSDITFKGVMTNATK